MRVLGFIPARLESKRYPNKLIKNIFDFPMVENVRRRVKISGVFNKIFVVTNSKKLKKNLIKYTQDIIITKKKHFNGTSRVSEISKNFKYDYAFVIFGDEPFLNYKMLIHCRKIIIKNKNIDIFNVTTNLKKNDFNSSSVVKVITNNQNLIIDYFRNKKIKNKKKLTKSCGVYIFKKKILDNFKKLKESKMEKVTNIEHFKFLENKLKVKSIFYKDIHPSINTKKEKNLIVNLIKRDKTQLKIIDKISNIT